MPNVIFLVTKHNRASVSALAAAMEENPLTSEVPFTYAKTPEEITAGSVAVISFTTLNILETAEAVHSIRERCGEEITIIAGGAHPSAEPEETLRLGADYVIRGEGEISFPGFINSLIRGDDPLSVKGVSGWRNGEAVISGYSPKVELDKHAPFPVRPKNFSYIEITRGCPAACRYCQASYLFGNSYRHRSIENINYHLKRVVDVGMKDIRFSTPDCLSYGVHKGESPDLDIVQRLLETMSETAKDRNIYMGTFPAEIWPASVSREGIGLLKRYCANSNIVIGAQTGSERMLEHLHRRHTVQDVIDAVRIIREAGYITNVDFLFGLPGETEEDEILSLKLMEELTTMGARIHAHAFMPLAGTPLSHSPPPVFSEKTLKALNRLTGKGLEFGQWRRQRNAASMIYHFRKRFLETGDTHASKAYAEEVSSIL
ncbi:TIGR04013 family B12-binding domain/radical SAM domain-containing protein [Limisalsivibrio acetivorans]|uniref:TIGR04013 family B12-binding domain/radical SAM domain-containing protein n=1 Tax=Limisalsivibrio acetivorans TaxID=1304888 RepID=UPI0003B58FE2|nr:TIGR04013 family B12-binding domain/radical SAM domain-containing protein [Limisalsivibrio acetivorans]